MKHYRVSFEAEGIPAIEVWAAGYNRNGDGGIQFYTERPTRAGMSKEPVLRLYGYPPARIDEVDGP